MLYKNFISEIKSQPKNSFDDECGSEQVHINLGNDDFSVIVSFATPINTTTSSVVYSTNENDLFENINVQTAFGTVASYSELIYITSFLYQPAMVKIKIIFFRCF